MGSIKMGSSHVLSIKPISYVDLLEASRLLFENPNPSLIPTSPVSPQHSNLGNNHSLYDTHHRSRDSAQLVEYLSSLHEGLGPICSNS